MKRFALAALLLMLMLASAPALAVPVEILSENFDGVTPGQLPPGTVATGSVNVRPTSDVLNVTARPSGLGGFFPSGGNFLVLGDDSGLIGGTPSSGVSEIVFDLDPIPGATLIQVYFDYAFAGASARLAFDVFDVYLDSASTGKVSLATYLSPGLTGTFQNAGSFGVELSLEGFDLETLTLGFKLNEAVSTATNSVLALDNLLVLDDPPVTAPVPEPPSLGLLVVAFLITYYAGRRLPRWISSSTKTNDC